VINQVRSLWYLGIAAQLRRALFSSVPVVQRFADGYGAALSHVTLAVEACTSGAIAAFAYYFLPIDVEQYRKLHMLLPLALAVASLAMVLASRGARRTIASYLGRGPERTGVDESGVASATAVYVTAQALPYRLALAHLSVWTVAAVV